MSEVWNIRFGTAGTSDSFAAQGYKSSLDVPEYTAKMGLNAFEYQCGRGVRLGQTHHLPLRQLRQTEPGGGAGKGAGYHAPRCGCAGRGGL